MTTQNLTRRKFLTTSCLAVSGAAAGLGTKKLWGKASPKQEEIPNIDPGSNHFFRLSTIKVVITSWQVQSWFGHVVMLDINRLRKINTDTTKSVDNVAEGVFIDCKIMIHDNTKVIQQGISQETCSISRAVVKAHPFGAIEISLIQLPLGHTIAGSTGDIYPEIAR